jgi:cellulose synthase/poly-beta-1,6-N-acetylglucosamine synthase-like glycosyltransferase
MIVLKFINEVRSDSKTLLLISCEGPQRTSMHLNGGKSAMFAAMLFYSIWCFVSMCFVSKQNVIVLVHPSFGECREDNIAVN